uniref:basic proline-rich protein-like n=1 Tax=Panthera onca TaxID=9690 RepID=UPI0029534087|nr:basic proline-rich protein-like [Panthera onca]
MRALGAQRCPVHTDPAALSPAWALSSLHAPPHPLPAACDQARVSARPPPRGPWGAPPPRWPPRPSRTTASPGDRLTLGPLQQPAGVGAAPGGPSGVVPWSPGSTRPRVPGPEGSSPGLGHRRLLLLPPAASQTRGSRCVPLRAAGEAGGVDRRPDCG